MGVDGCKCGWLSVALGEGRAWEVNLFHNISSLWENYHNASLILVDIPIGLREGGRHERLCDLRARNLLGRPRGAGVFPAPCRPALKSTSYEQACEINEQLTGKKLSRQTFAIIPKIMDMDTFLYKHRDARWLIRETHPEICFWAMSGQAMKHHKTTEEGFTERKQILTKYFPQTPEMVAETLIKYKLTAIGKDDILDALAAAITITTGLGELATIPEKPEIDAQGLPMEMVCRRIIHR